MGVVRGACGLGPRLRAYADSALAVAVSGRDGAREGGLGYRRTTARLRVGLSVTPTPFKRAQIALSYASLRGAGVVLDTGSRIRLVGGCTTGGRWVRPPVGNVRITPPSTRRYQRNSERQMARKDDHAQVCPGEAGFCPRVTQVSPDR
ncbi:hypothetical protein GCM10022221_69840 [Actinocorallia aurea]